MINKSKQKMHIASRKKRDDGWYEEEWYTANSSIPVWWNHEIHCLLEKKIIGGVGFVKYCLLCKKEIPDIGCKHNAIKNT